MVRARINSKFFFLLNHRMRSLRFYFTPITKLIPSVIFSCVQRGCRFPAFLACFVTRSLWVPLGVMVFTIIHIASAVPSLTPFLMPCPVRFFPSCSLWVHSYKVLCVFHAFLSALIHLFLAGPPRDSRPLFHAVPFCSSVRSLVHCIVCSGHGLFFSCSL